MSANVYPAVEPQYESYALGTDPAAARAPRVQSQWALPHQRHSGFDDQYRASQQFAPTHTATDTSIKLSSDIKQFAHQASSQAAFPTPNARGMHNRKHVSLDLQSLHDTLNQSTEWINIQPVIKSSVQHLMNLTIQQQHQLS